MAGMLDEQQALPPLGLTAAEAGCRSRAVRSGIGHAGRHGDQLGTARPLGGHRRRLVHAGRAAGRCAGRADQPGHQRAVGAGRRAGAGRVVLPRRGVPHRRRAWCCSTRRACSPAAGVTASLRRWADDPIHTLVYTHGHVDHVGGSGALVADGRERGHADPRVVGHENVAAAVRPLPGHQRLEPGHQRPPVRTVGLGRGADGRVAELPARRHRCRATETYRDDLDLHVGGLDLQLHHAAGRDRRPHLGVDPVAPGRGRGRLRGLGVPQRRQPAEGPALPVGVGRRPAADAGPRARAAAARPRPAGGRPRSGGDGARRPGHRARAPGRRRGGGDERRRHPRRDRPRGPGRRRPAPATLAAPDLRRARVRGPQRLAPLRRVVGRRPGPPQAAARALALAAELADLAGGADRLAARAQELSEAGDHRMACQLVELAARAGDDPGLWSLRADLYRSGPTPRRRSWPRACSPRPPVPATSGPEARRPAGPSVGGWPTTQTPVRSAGEQVLAGSSSGPTPRRRCTARRDRRRSTGPDGGRPGRRRAPAAPGRRAGAGPARCRRARRVAHREVRLAGVARGVRRAGHRAGRRRASPGRSRAASSPPGGGASGGPGPGPPTSAGWPGPCASAPRDAAARRCRSSTRSRPCSTRWPTCPPTTPRPSWVRDRAAELAGPWADAAADDPLGRSVVHGDLHAGNVVRRARRPAAHRPRADRQRARRATTPRPPRSPSPATAPTRPTLVDFLDGFGADPTAWSGFATFVAVYELWVTAWAVGVRHQDPTWAAEAARRVATLRDGTDEPLDPQLNPGRLGRGRLRPWPRRRASWR